MMNPHPVAEWFRKDLEKVQADLLVVLRHHWPAVGHQVISTAIIETTGSVCAAIIEDEPSAQPDIDTKVGQLHLFIAATGTQHQ